MAYTSFGISGAPISALPISAGYKPRHLSLVKTEAADTISAACAVEVTGALAKTEAADTFASAGLVDLTADADITEAADTISSVGVTTIVFTAAITEAADTVSSTAVAAVVAAAAVTETADTVSAAATNPIAGAASKTEAADTISAVASVPPALFAAAITEAADTLSAASAVAIVGRTERRRYPFAISGGPISSGAISGQVLAPRVRDLLEARDRVTQTRLADAAITEAADTGAAVVRIEDAREQKLKSGPLFGSRTILAGSDDLTNSAPVSGDLFTARPTIRRKTNIAA